MKTVGPGAREIRLSDVEGTFRVIYVAKFEDAVFVLHCFQKKTQKTVQPVLIWQKVLQGITKDEENEQETL